MRPAEDLRRAPPPEGAWRLKARQLDRYRWQLLRERHAWPGAALRFCRGALLDLLFGLRAHFALAQTVPADGESCAFLLLHSAPKVIPLQRKKQLVEALRGAGHRLLEAALDRPPAIVAGRMLQRPPQPVPLRYFGYAAHAEWLVARHRPQVLLNDRNGSLYSPFLRLSLARRGALLVQLAHATTLEDSRRLSMTDYDYYFLFGQSSLEALRARRLRFGDTQAVLAGSYLIDRAYDLPPADGAMRTLLILGVGPDREKEAGFQDTYALLRDWAASQPDYRVLVKTHPRSRMPFWREAAGRHANIELLPAGCSLAEALSRSSVALNIMSNAVIEAALAQRPVIYCNLGSERDIFAQERFFGAVLTRPEAIRQRLLDIEQHYAQHVEQSRAFIRHHLAHGVAGLETTRHLLEALLSGAGLPEGIEQCRLPGAS